MGDKADTTKREIFRALLLSESQQNSLATLCAEANKLLESNTLGDAPMWVRWLDGLRIDAERLLDEVTEEREKLASGGETKKIIDKRVAQIKNDTQPNLGTKRNVRKAIGKYEMPAVVTFDEKQGRLNRQFKIPDDASVETIRHLIFGAAISNREWQLLRRCRKVDCQTYFCDTPDRRPQRDCCPQHGVKHRRTKPIGD